MDDSEIHLDVALLNNSLLYLPSSDECGQF